MFTLIDPNDRFTIHITRNFDCVSNGYRVQLHDLPTYTFLVDAPTADDAQRAAFRAAQSEGRAKSDAATIQRL